MEGEHGEGREAAAAESDEMDPLSGRRAALRVVEGSGCGGGRRRGKGGGGDREKWRPRESDGPAAAIRRESRGGGEG